MVKNEQQCDRDHATEGSPGVFTVLLAGLYIAGGISFVVGWASGASDWDPNVLEALIFTIVPFVAGTLVIFGMFKCER